MTLANFQKWVREGWRKNPRDNDLAIMALGLAGEAGEVLQECRDLAIAVAKVTEPIKKQLRGDGPLDREKLALELGDVAHYLTAIADQFDLDMEDILNKNVGKIEARRAAKAAA